MTNPDMLVRVQVPATSANLGAGYDSLGVALQRHVTVTATPATTGGRDGQRVTTTGHGAGRVPVGEGNLVWSSLVAFCQHVDVAVPDVVLTVDNAIPLARGLGSSSAAIVAGLVVGRYLVGVKMPTPDLVDLATAMEGHPDNVAPALLGGFVAGGLADDDTTIVRRGQPTSSLTVVVAIPGVEQMTAVAREMVPETLSRRDVVAQVGRAAHLTGALVGAWPPDPRLCGDVLHEPARLARMEVTAALLAAWRGAEVFSWLSGAGPAAAALVADDPAAIDHAIGIARRVLADWDVDGDAAPGAHEVCHLPFDHAGATVIGG